MTEPSMTERKRPGARRTWWWLLALLLAGGGAAYYHKDTIQDRIPGLGGTPAQSETAKKGKRNPADRVVPVIAAAASSGDVSVYLTGLGTVTPLATVAVRSRIDGQLMKVLFREGQLVQAGDLLAEIDPRTYEVQLAQAEGQMARDQALLKNAQLDLERYRLLFQQDSVAKQQLDTQEALVRQYEGTVKIDQAAIDSARLQLTYCRITAPISGRLGLRQVDPGNMVRASDVNGLVVITQLQPISVVFTIPEDNLRRVMGKLRAGEKLPVEAYDRADKVKLASGTLLAADNQIDPATGTVKLKAQFANDDNALFASQFVNARMLVEVKRGATMIPSAAVLRGSPGTFVYVAKGDGTATVRKIVLGPVQGESVAIESGLAPGEMVVIDGADRLREGARVSLTTREAAAARDAARKSAPPVASSQGAAAQGAPAGKGAAAVPPAAGAKGAAGGAAAGTEQGAAQGGAQRGSGGGWDALTPEERLKRWKEINARIDRGEFGEELKKLPEEERKQVMRDIRRQREVAAAAGGQPSK